MLSLLLFSACVLHRSYVKCAIVLSGIYIKGFKTFARPVRMPLEGGITAIVGPNGSGKSNITDAVLFALGEQSPGVLRAGAIDRKSTRLNSSHANISYAVFCLKKKNEHAAD